MEAARKEGQTRSEVLALLEVAKSQGGALAEVAEELTSPKQSILATVGNKFKDAFGTFIDILQTPSNVVAGALSSDFTIKEAMEKNLSVSEVLLGKKEATGVEGAVDSVGRFAIDVLTDPLTYVTFGASRGFMGLSAAKELFVGTKTAEKLGIQAGDKAALSKAGEDLLDKQITRQRSGMRHDYLKNERIRIANESLQRGELVNEEEMARKLKELDDLASDDLIEKALNRRLSHTDAYQAVSRLIENNPALLETLVDKGGIKFFGKSILSAQRIRDTKALIPGMALADHAWEPVRRAIYPLFSTEWTTKGRISAITDQVRQRALDANNSAMADVLDRVRTLAKSAKLTEPEVDIINSLVEARKAPADPVLAQYYNEAMYGKIGEMSRIGVATRTLRGIEKRNLREMRKAGVRVNDTENHALHILTDGEAARSARSSGMSTKTGMQKLASVTGFINKEGTEFLGRAAKTPEGLRFVPTAIRTAEGEVTKLDELSQMAVGSTFGDMKKQGGRDPFYIDKDGVPLKRFRVSVDEARDLMDVPFEKNQILLTTMASAEAARVSTANYFLKDLTKLSGRTREMAPDHYVKINVSQFSQELGDLEHFLKAKDGGDLFFNPADAKMVEDFLAAFGKDEAIDKLWKSYDRVNNLFKASVTSIWPAFHGRNAISNVFLNFLDIGIHALNPANHVLVASTMLKEARYSKLMGKIDMGDATAMKELEEMNNNVVFRDKYNYNWSFGELRQAIRKNVIAFNPNITGFVDWSQTPREMAEGISKNLVQTTTKGKLQQAKRSANFFTQDFLPYRTGRVVGSAVEDHARLLNFMVNLKKTGDVQMAAARTKQFLFDYQNLTKFEKTFLRRVIPFYTFMRKNVELQVKTLFTNPGRISTEIHAVQSVGEVLSGASLTDEEREKLPDWMKSSLLIPVSKRGGVLEVITGLSTPIESLFKIARPNEMLSSVSPLVRLPVEMASGFSFFHAQNISERTRADEFASAPKIIQDFIGMHKIVRDDGKVVLVSLRPERKHLIENLPPFSRIWTQLGDLGDPNISSEAKTLESIFGLKAYSTNLDENEERRERELKRQIEDLLDTAGVGYTFTKYVAPKEE